MAGENRLRLDKTRSFREFPCVGKEKTYVVKIHGLMALNRMLCEKRMIELQGKEIESSGWAGPLLWLITKDGYSIHFYDGDILLNGISVSIGEDINNKVIDSIIKKLVTNQEGFMLVLATGTNIHINSAANETARVFKKGDLQSHYFYKNGAFISDQD